MTPTEAIPGHIIEALHITTTVLIVITMTPHTEDHPHTEVPQLIPGIAGDPDHGLHITQVRGPCINLHPILMKLQ